MSPMQHLVIFILDDQRYALPLSAVERVVRAVEVTPVPQGPKGIVGVINVEGEVVPVVNTRRKFGLPERGIETSDQFVIAHRPELPLSVDPAGESSPAQAPAKA